MHGCCGPDGVAVAAAQGPPTLGRRGRHGSVRTADNTKSLSQDDNLGLVSFGPCVISSSCHN